MKIIKSIILVVTVLLAFTSCQKELVFNNNGVSAGSFKKDGAGNCQPVVITGIFKAGEALTNALFVDIQVSVSTPGTFDIRSDTINGYSFSKIGTVVFGINTVRLYPNGKPVFAGKNNFTVKYGTSTCSFEITVNGPTAPAATFTLGGSPGACTGAVVGGIYTANTALTPANTLTIQVDVSNPGSYVIGAVATSGFIFNGSGVFTSTGLQNVTLTGSGTPGIAGNTAVTVTNLSSSCTFDITVLPGGGGGGGGGGGTYYFEFTDGAKHLVADPTNVIALSINNSGFVLLSVGAFSAGGDSSFSVSVSTLGNPQTGVVYKTSNIGVPLSMFNVLSTTMGQVYQADFSTPAQNIDIKFDVIDTVNKIVSGTFSGTAMGLSGVATITSGKFKALLQ
jgi:hypothetical protein